MKGKGIIIELTALLDVILIMLFWVMMNMKDETEAVQNEAEAKVSKVQQKYSQLVEDYELLEMDKDEMSSEYEEEVNFLQDKLDNLDTDAAVNQRALDRYTEGLPVMLNLKYDSVGKLFVYDDESEIGKTLLISKDKVAECIMDSLEAADMSEDDVILCALVYDGERALYRDVKMVRDAIDEVGVEYRHFYCTYINTNR